MERNYDKPVQRNHHAVQNRNVFALCTVAIIAVVLALIATNHFVTQWAANAAQTEFQSQMGDADIDATQAVPNTAKR